MLLEFFDMISSSRMKFCMMAICLCLTQCLFISNPGRTGEEVNPGSRGTRGEGNQSLGRAKGMGMGMGAPILT